MRAKLPRSQSCVGDPHNKVQVRADILVVTPGGYRPGVPQTCHSDKYLRQLERSGRDPGGPILWLPPAGGDLVGVATATRPTVAKRPDRRFGIHRERPLGPLPTQLCAAPLPARTRDRQLGADVQQAREVDPCHDGHDRGQRHLAGKRAPLLHEAP